MDQRESRAKSLLEAMLGNMNAVSKAYFESTGRELDLQLFLDLAKEDCAAYFGTPELPPAVPASCLAKLARLHFEACTQQYSGVKSASYTEGSVSMSETYSTPADMEALAETVLKPYNRYRVVRAHEIPNAESVDENNIHLPAGSGAKPGL